MKLEPSAAGALFGALAFAFAVQPINHASKELESNGKEQNSTRRGRDKHAPFLASVSAARTTGNGRLPAMKPTCIRRSVKLLSAVLLRRLERENGSTSTVEADMWWMLWRTEAERRAQGGGGGQSGEEVGGGHGED